MDASLRTLILGDGDFSFGLSYSRRYKSIRLTATSFDPHEELLSKYPTAQDNVSSMKAAGARVLHGVDATNLAPHFGSLQEASNSCNLESFDTIIFNNPHIGVEDLHRHRFLLAHFFAEAREHLVRVRMFATALSVYAGKSGLWAFPVTIVSLH